MALRNPLLAGILLVLASQWLTAQEPVFSGPQIDEKLPGFKAIQLVGKEKGQEFDLVESANTDPLVIIFMHKLTRPAFGLTRTLQRYALSLAEKPLHTAVIVLSDDANETMQAGFLQYLPPEAKVGVSPDGLEGPGAYGLNRNVELTILVGKQGTVTANFALVQPSLPTDGPKVLRAIAEVVGEEPPSLEELQQQDQAMNARMQSQRRRQQPDGKPRRDPSRENPRDAKLDSMKKDGEG